MLDRVNRRDGFSMKKQFRSSARGASFHTKHASNAKVCRVVSLVVNHRLSINRPTKCGKEKSPSDGHCQCKKEMDDYLLACQQKFDKVPHSDTLTKERASFLKLMKFHFLERLTVIIVVL
jgi:hypothetical protein